MQCDAFAPEQVYDKRQIQFSEATGSWQIIPKWVDSLLMFGYMWAESERASRKIGLISMPCDSAASGLVALGAMRRRLELDGANDLASHFQRIQALALHGNIQATLFYRKKRGREHGPYLLDGQFSAGLVWVKLESSPDLRRTISFANAIDWQFDEEAPVQVHCGDKVPYERHYAELVNGGAAVVASNLLRSDSGICLAGRVTGEGDTQRNLAEIRFRADGRVADLSQLLTIQGWSPGTISRVSFFNSRTGMLDRRTGQPRLVVADGGASFLKVVEGEEFKQSDILGVIHTAVERDKLEELGSKLASLDQWYVRDIKLRGAIPSLPRGIAVAILTRR